MANQIVHGGPVYWAIRNGLNFVRRNCLRKFHKWCEYNWDWDSAAFSNMPKRSFDPKMNEWVFHMDVQEWGGIGDRVVCEFALRILLYYAAAQWLLLVHWRMDCTGKYNTFSKWRKAEGEE
eukprot:GDKI01042475.1.p2 GENE.GDKI01042475.1~~GDKI01042475.1.p2  ORF type:complete len:121 (-),score=35.68 GDKI01042475.1:189-551(-)